jgi:hypothetical protein
MASMISTLIARYIFRLCHWGKVNQIISRVQCHVDGRDYVAATVSRVTIYIAVKMSLG